MTGVDSVMALYLKKYVTVLINLFRTVLSKLVDQESHMLKTEMVSSDNALPGQGSGGTSGYQRQPRGFAPTEHLPAPLSVPGSAQVAT